MFKTSDENIFQTVLDELNWYSFTDIISLNPNNCFIRDVCKIKCKSVDIILW